MNIFIVCKDYEREAVTDASNKYFMNPSVKYIDYKEVPEKIMTDPVVISKDSVEYFKGIHIAGNSDNLYVCFAGYIFQASTDDQLVEKRNEMIEQKNWATAKNINGILSAFDFLLQREECKGMPDYLQIETTSYCNAKCIMCSHYFSNNKGATHLRQETLDNMEDAIQLSSTISLNGMGEPFVSPEVCDQIDYYTSFGNRIVTNTNMSVLNDRIIAQINTSFDWLEISIDGASQEMYENIRKNLSYDTLKNNLLRLKKECPNVRKHIATVIMRQNVHEMPEMVELAYEAGANIITFMTLNSNIIIQNSIDEMSRYPKVLEYYSVKALEKGKELGIPVIVPNAGLINMSIRYEDIEEELSSMKDIAAFKSPEQEIKMCQIADVVSVYLQSNDEIQRDTIPSNVRCYGICDWILKHSYVDLNGNVAMCCRNQSFHMGNVNEEKSFAGVWNGAFYKKLRKIFYSGYLPESCLKCGLVESGNLKYLSVDIDDKFYMEPEYKVRQKKVLNSLLKELDS